MTYTHKTNHSSAPPIKFWRPFENLFQGFPFWEGGSPYDSEPSERLIKYYEKRTHDPFDTHKVTGDIYSYAIRQTKGIRHTVNYLGRLIKYLSNSIAKSDTVYKFQQFFESMYYYLREIIELNPKNKIVQQFGLEDKDYPYYEKLRNKLFNNNGGLIKPNEYLDYFNSACRMYKVPFVMFTQNDECYVVHITDIFIEKIIRDLPKFLSHPNLNHANSIFIEAYRNRDMGNDKDCLAKVREGLEAVRDYIYNRYSLSKGTSLHYDMKGLFDQYSNTVFDFTRIPENRPTKLHQITDYLRDSLLLAVKFGNFGHHTLQNPNLVEENTSLFSLGLVASIFPYLLYLLK